MILNIESFRGIRLAGKGDLYRLMMLARQEAMKSHHRTPVGCVIARRGIPIAVGHNSAIRTHPEAGHERTVHAELDAIIGMDRAMLRHAVCVVYRHRVDGSLGMAQPCANCTRVLHAVGIRCAIFTHPESIYQEIKIS